MHDLAKAEFQAPLELFWRCRLKSIWLGFLTPNAFPVQLQRTGKTQLFWLQFLPEVNITSGVRLATRKTSAVLLLN